MVYGDVPGKLNFGDIPGSWYYYNNPGRLDYIVAVTRIVGLCGNFPDSLFGGDHVEIVIAARIWGVCIFVVRFPRGV